MIAVRVVFTIVILIFAQSASLLGKPVTISSVNLSLDIPDDWRVWPEPEKQITNGIFYAVNNFHDCLIIVEDPDSKGLKIDLSHIKAMEAGMIKSPGTSILGEEPVNLDIASTYCIAMKKNPSGEKPFYAYLYPFTINGKLYCMSTQSFDQERALKMQSIAKSAHFVGTPSQ